VLERSPTLWIQYWLMDFPKMEIYVNNACTHKDWILSLIILYVPIWFIEIFSSHQETLPFLFWDKLKYESSKPSFFYRDAIWMEGFKPISSRRYTQDLIYLYRAQKYYSQSILHLESMLYPKSKVLFILTLRYLRALPGLTTVISISSSRFSFYFYS